MGTEEGREKSKHVLKAWRDSRGDAHATVEKVLRRKGFAAGRIKKKNLKKTKGSRRTGVSSSAHHFGELKKKF